MSKKLLAFVTGCGLIMTIVIMTFILCPEVINTDLIKLVIQAIVLLCSMYGFQNIFNNFVKSKWFSMERLENKKK